MDIEENFKKIVYQGLTSLGAITGWGLPREKIGKLGKIFPKSVRGQ